MTPTVYQKPEIRDANDNIIQQGAFGKNTALANSTNDGWVDYVANDLEFLYDIAKDEIVPVPALPASGQTNKTYLLTTTGVSYRWSGTQWVAVSSSEAVGRAESAANLAEQWATKTDGTVDGTEYSAKYYAEQAQQSADDAQDVADDMATHLVQIDKNTGGVSKNSKRISNIEKLLQGNLYDYDTDDDTAYTKTVPSGALPYAGIEQIGGKTIVWNQLVRDGNFALGDTTYWKTQSGTSSTISFADGVATITFNSPYPSDASVFNPAITQQTGAQIQAVQGHKYLIKVEAMADFTITGLYFSSAAMGSSFTIDHEETKDVWISFSKIITAANSGRLFGYIGARGITGIVQGSKLNFRNIIMIDLTLMFGSGNEPSTVAEFEAMFPADYYEYNAGTLLSAGVTEVESRSANLADFSGGAGVPSDTSSSNSTKRIFHIGKYIAGLAFNNVYSASQVSAVTTGDGTLSFTSYNSIYGVGVPFNCKASTTYSVSVGTITNGNTVLSWYGEDGSFLSYNSVTASQPSVTSPANAKQGVLCLYSATVNKTSTFQNIQVEENSSVTPYSPVGVIATYPIPAEVQALDGYGWSAGNARNYIDFERKVYVKQVHAVDMGTLTWSGYDSTKNAFYKLNNTFNPAIKRPSSGYNVVCSRYKTVPTQEGNDKSICMPTGTGNFSVKDTETLGTTTSALSTLLAGVMLYYELATPVETDISQYITDNLVEVGAGGTLTFPNSNGNDYHIPVPSDVTYMIDLQEAISNG